MEKHLQSAVQRFEQEESNISPISSIDAEIIVELGQIFDKLGQPELKSIVRQWKSLHDDKIRDMLLDWNVVHPKLSEDDDDDDQPKSKKRDSKKKNGVNSFSRKFMDFEEKMLDTFFIKTIEKDFRFDDKRRGAFHCIVFNVGIEGIYQNLTFNYGNEKLRDDAYKKLKILLESTNNIEFVN